MKYIGFTLLLISSIIFGQTSEENTTSLKWKDFTIHNNKWGEHKVKKGVYSQSIFIKDGKPGWKWETPGKSYGVIGYPEIWYGQSAWLNLNDITTDNYFKNINDIKKFEITYSSTLHVNNKKYNLAFDFWLHHSPKVAVQTIGIEVMVWEDYNKFKPFGKKIGSISTSFGEYTIYKGLLNKKDLNTSWEYIAFVRKNKRTSGKVDILELINEMNKRNYIKNNIYLSSIEFGTEILNSSGNIMIDQYDLDIQ